MAQRSFLVRVLRRLAAVLLGLVLMVVLVELGVRFLPFSVPDGVRAHVSIHAGRNVVEAHPRLGWALVPELQDEPVPSADFELFHVSTAALGEDRTGFRGEHGSQPMGVVVGDSFVFGFGVEQDESLPAYLSQSMGAEFGNFGVYGYGPQQAGLVLRDYALPRGPEVALWVFFENDLNDANQFLVNPPDPRARGTTQEEGDWHNTYWTGFKYWRYRSPYLSSRREHFQSGPVELILHYNPFPELNLERPEIQAGWAATKGALADFQRDCAAAGVLPVLALMPFKETVYRAEFEGVARRQDVPWAVLDDSRAQVREYAEGLGLATLDLTPFLRGVRDQPVFQVADAHLSPLGNRLVAEHLADFLRAKLDR